MAFNCTGRQWSDQSVSEKRVVVMLTDCFGTDAIQILSSCEQLPLELTDIPESAEPLDL